MCSFVLDGSIASSLRFPFPLPFFLMHLRPLLPPGFSDYYKSHKPFSLVRFPLCCSSSLRRPFWLSTCLSAVSIVDSTCLNSFFLMFSFFHKLTLSTPHLFLFTNTSPRCSPECPSRVLGHADSCLSDLHSWLSLSICPLFDLRPAFLSES